MMDQAEPVGGCSASEPNPHSEGMASTAPNRFFTASISISRASSPAVTGLAHSTVVTAADVHDKHPLPELLHGQEERV